MSANRGDNGGVGGVPQEPTLVIKLQGPNSVQVAGSEEVLSSPGLFYMMLELARIYMDVKVVRHSTVEQERVIRGPQAAGIPPTPP